jgi:hypothetical protein
MTTRIAGGRPGSLDVTLGIPLAACHHRMFSVVPRGIMRPEPGHLEVTFVMN